MHFARPPIARAAGIPAALLLLLAPSAAFALQPIEDFLKSARAKSLDNIEATQLAQQRAAEADQAWAAILPAFTARATYQRNQFATEIQQPGADPIVIVPKDQLDASLTLEVPIFNLGAWTRIGASSAFASAAKARTLATAQEVERAVTARWVQVVASEALVEASGRNLDAAEQSRRVVQQRKNVGFASTLEVDRADAQVARATQAMAEAELTRATSRRALESLTRLPPSPGAAPLMDDLREEAPLAQWESSTFSNVPAVRAAELEQKGADKSKTAAWESAFVPTIGGLATERFTNATGFSGNNASWLLALTATWRLDLVGIEGARAQDAAAAAAQTRVAKARLDTSDQVFVAWQQVKAQIAKSRAARVQADAAAHAAKLARESYQAGAATQLDLIEAERDAFQGAVLRIQADADLAFARANLRLSAGLAGPAARESKGGGQ